MAKSEGLCVNNEDQVPKRGKSKLGDPRPPTGGNSGGCTNILLETCQFPIGKELQTDNTKKHILLIFLMLTAPIYWCNMVSSTKALVRYTIEMLAAQCLFAVPLPL